MIQLRQDRFISSYSWTRGRKRGLFLAVWWRVIIGGWMGRCGKVSAAAPGISFLGLGSAKDPNT
jgi:hypothetical protein